MICCFNWGPRRKSKFETEAGARFQFDSNAHGYANTHGMNAGISVPDHWLTDYFFGQLYRGNKVDMSRMMNGHAPSRFTAEVAALPSDAIWAYESHYPEAMAVLSANEEPSRIHFVLDRIADIRRLMRAHVLEHQCDSVIDVRQRVELDNELLKNVELVAVALVKVVNTLQSTQFFKVCTALGEQVHPEAAAAARKRHLERS